MQSDDRKQGGGVRPEKIEEEINPLSFLHQRKMSVGMAAGNSSHL
jgi:hypothetical protein